MTLAKVSSETVKKQDILAAEEVNQNGLYLFAKRFIDIFGSLCGIILLSPIFLIVVVLIKLEDPKGPVLLSRFVLERMKKNLGCTNFVQW